MTSVDREEAVIAGRPKTMVKRVERFEILAYELACQIRQAVPQMYRDNPETTDPIGSGWNESLKAAIHLWTMVEDLGDDLRHKAGIEREGPTAYCRLRGDGLDEPFCPPEEDNHVEAVPPPGS